MSRSSRKPKPTPSSNKHVFESFSRRIARLKIDPVHTVKGRSAIEESSDLSHSYFRSALDEWSSLNLTSTFTSFLRSANGRSENLPQILHHADRIFDLLVEHIQRRDALALEPLLDLMAHFAHDLGQSFEKYFERTVSLVAEVASTVDAPDVVEWSFTCLAWMFKYLARLLVQDLRPLLRIFRPYLTARKEHVSRFSAESLAFLVRKAAILYPKKRSPLELTLTELLSGATSDFSSQQGLMALFVESCLGVDMQLHSAAEHLMECLMQTSNVLDTDEARKVAVGSLVGLVHETESSSFHAIVAKIVESAQAAIVKGDTKDLSFANTLLQAVIGARKGARITDWRNVVTVYVAILSHPAYSAQAEQPQKRLLTSALLLQYTPLNELLPLVTTLLDATTRNLQAVDFFAFCTFVADLGKDRFHQFLLPRLQDFIKHRFSENETGLMLTLERLHDNAIVSPIKSHPGYIECPRDWISSLAARIAGQSEDDNLAHAMLIGLCRLPRSIRIPSGFEAGKALLSAMRERIIAELNSSRLENSLSSRLSLGWLLESFITLSTDDEDLQTLHTELSSAQPLCWKLLPFLRATNALTLRLNYPIAQDIRTLETLISNLLLQDKEMRRESLLLLEYWGKSTENPWLRQTAADMLEILNTQYMPANARILSMLVRRLPQIQRSCPKDPVLEVLIPKFCLGALELYHDQVRKDLCRSLGEIIDGTHLEDTVIDTLVSWLVASGSPASPSSARADSPPKSSAFQDMSLLQAQKSAEESTQLYEDPAARLIASADHEHRLHRLSSPIKGRKLALDTMLEIISIAEKKSRFITPVFLNAQFTKSVHDASETSESSGSSHTLSHECGDSEWSLPERKSFMALFAKCQNPRVLFKSSDVYRKLLELLTNGNVDIRKHSLLAILKWKDPTLEKHEDLLLKVVDEKILSTDIGLVLNADSEDNPVKSGERSAVLPILLRLIYGLLVGRTGSYGTQEARRKSLLRMLFRMRQSEIAIYLDIAVGKLSEIELGRGGSLANDELQHDIITRDQQYGFVRMLSSTLQALQTTFVPFGKHVIEPLLYCTMRASSLIESSTSGSQSLERNIRRTGLECLTAMFKNDVEVDWQLYITRLFSQVISPRLEGFAQENMQSVSVLLRLISQWCHDEEYVPFLTAYDDRLMPELWQILAAHGAKAEVKVFILEEIILPLLALVNSADAQGGHASGVLKKHQAFIENSLQATLESAPPADLLKAVTAVILEFAPLRAGEQQGDNMISLLVDLMSTSKHRLTPAVKSGILRAINALLSACDGRLTVEAGSKLFVTTSSLFSYFKDQPNRLVLCEILGKMANSDERVEAAARICLELNAMASNRLDEVDFDRRLPAFQALTTLPVNHESLMTWRPILHNLLFFAQDEDFNIRSNAVSSLRSFIKRASELSSDDTKILDDVVLPTVQKGITHESELMRADFLSLLGLLIEHGRNDRLSNMTPLLVGSDEEASFFSNVLHIQQHRRLRAIRRLITEVEKGSISAVNISQIFLPLLQKFIKDETPDESAQSAKGQSLIAMITLLQWIEWKHFKSLFKQYKSELENEDSQRTAIKMLNQAAEALLHAANGRTAVEVEGISALARSLPDEPLFSAQVKEHLLPKLADFVHFKDEAEMNSRLPAATVAIKLIRLLPTEEGHVLSAPIVLDVANVLKSRAQEARDAGRAVLIEIVQLLGPESVQFVLRQLRTVLQRGYQLHVLSFTLHAILVKIAPTVKLSELDYCLDDIVSIAMDDTFGAVGQEKDNEDYISSMKEVKSKKSFDTMELMARSSSLDHLGRLIHPITVLLTGPLNAKQVRQVDEMLRRVGVGLSGNPGASEQGLLVFAYQTIQSFYKEKSAPVPIEKTNDEKNRERFILQKSASRSTSSSALLFKVARFAIDLVRSALLKHNSLLTPENVHGFLPVIGDALVEGQEDVKISAMRLLSAILKLRMPELDDNCLLYVQEAVRVVKNCTSTNEEAAQAALKLLVAILREKKAVQVRDSDISEVLRRISPDLEEPDRQGVTFNFIRAVLARKYQLPEVYEIVDKIAVIMVTSQAQGARDVARGVYVHFLIEYPQASNRWTKQQRFLIKNLEYDYYEGRQSVMEAVNTLLSKTTGDTTQQLVSAFFIPIILRMANDEHVKCRDLAGALLGQLFTKADDTRLEGMLEPLQGWLNQDDNTDLLRISLQAFAVLFTVRQGKLEEELVLCRTRIAKILPTIPDDCSDDTRLQAFRLLAVLVESRPSSIMASKSDSIWKHVRGILRSNIPERTIAASLVRTFLQECPSKAKLPLVSAHGLRWDTAVVQDLLRSCVRIVKVNQEDAELSAEVLPIITMIAEIAHLNGLTIAIKAGDDASDEEETEQGSIPATQYILDQLAYILRRELPKHTTATLFPKTTSLQLLTTLIPNLPTASLSQAQLSRLLLPLLHLTSTTASTPFSADPTFRASYEALTNSAQEVMSLLQEKCGDEAYIKAMTAASKVAKERREERRRKRVLEQVADPERAARHKKVKGERARERRREVGKVSRGRRRGGGGDGY